MTNWTVAPPPKRQPAGNPVFEPLSAGTMLYRVHGDYPAHEFNPMPQPSRLVGGRFDSLDGAYAYTYLGDTGQTAIAETLCRDLPRAGAARLVPRVKVRGKKLSTVEVTRDLTVLVLHGAALTHVGATLALTKSDADQYHATRAWAVALRRWFPGVDGFRYRPRHDEDHVVWVLFDDGLDAGQGRAHGALRTVGSVELLDHEPGETMVRKVLHLYNATLS